jgi:hypothetical protein
MLLYSSSEFFYGTPHLLNKSRQNGWKKYPFQSKLRTNDSEKTAMLPVAKEEKNKGM